ncbi:hypothetical protein GQ44DRAFT_703363 [Phaeosphaeriaceae sp. PMI808]|nr:hypothetical protein GQ44DRAFT_703363 [Phaeosphaeriaceae sp. PMI808]
MRPILAPILLAPLTALATPNIFSPFEAAIPQSSPNTTIPDSSSSSPNDNNNSNANLELLRRQNSNACATNYFPCAALNAPGLCCPRTATCSPDQNRAVACCPIGALCTGTLGAPVATGTNPTPTTVFAQTTTANPFVQQTTVPNAAATARSTVQNAFYPFPYIATTYTDAAACSAAYTSCQSDAASCTTALANGAQGVTISAPNGGATITAVPSLGLQSAQSICASLSSQACYTLTVEACRSFGGQGANAAPTRGCGGYLMGAGVAVGIAGNLLR